MRSLRGLILCGLFALTGCSPSDSTGGALDEGDVETPIDASALTDAGVEPRGDVGVDEGPRGPACRTFHFTRDPRGPLQTVANARFPTTYIHDYGMLSDPAVIPDGEGGYRMWFSAVRCLDHCAAGEMGLATSYAESEDGLIWSDDHKHPSELVSWVLEPSGWDQHGLETVSVVEKVDGDLLLIYAGLSDPARSFYELGGATSEDGRTWTKLGDAPILEPTLPWEAPIYFDLDADGEDEKIGGLLEPTILFDAEAGLYRLWYAANSMVDGVFDYRMGYAESADGLTWRKHPEVVFERDPAPDAWDGGLVSHYQVVQDPSEGFHLFYIGFSRAQNEACEALRASNHARYGDDPELSYLWAFEYCQGASIGHAYSPDGLSWTRDPDNPLLSPRPGAWDGWMMFGPSVILEDGVFKLWYFSQRGIDQPEDHYVHFGLATAPCAP